MEPMLLEELQQALAQDAPYLQEQPDRAERWAFLTEGIEDDYTRVCTEVLLDNQVRVSQKPKSMLFEDAITTAQTPAFTTWSLPLIRRVFPNLISQNLVSMQPMKQATGKVFYFDITYAGTGSPVTYPRVDELENFSVSYSEAAEMEQVPELNLHITSADMTAKSKKLMYEISFEEEQDIDAYFGLNADDEMMTAISNQIARETDRDIIADLYANALASGAGNVNWDANLPTTAPWNVLDPKVYYRTLYDAIVDASTLVYKKRYRNPNWIVVGPDNGAILEKTDEFRLYPAEDNGGTVVYGPHLFGTLSSKFTVYKDPWLTGSIKDVILVGYKGQAAFETGYVYSPYVAAFLTQLIQHPETMSQRRGIMSRYGKKMLIPEMYATVTVTPVTP